MTATKLLQVQVGDEAATWGTSAAATAKLMGISNAKISSGLSVKLLKELRASLQPGFTAVMESNGGSASVDGTVTYEDICYFLESITSRATPAGGGPYVRTGNLPTTAVSTPRPQTLYVGSTAAVVKLLGALCVGLTIRGKTGEKDTELTFSADFVGKSVADGSLGVLSDRTVYPAMQSHLSVFLDTWAGTLGATALATTAIDFELSVKNPRNLKRYLEGGLTASAWEDKGVEPSDVTLKMSLEMNTTSAAYITAMLTPGLFQKQVRIKATDSTRILQLDFAGFAPSVPATYTDKNGLLTLDLVMHGQNHSTLTNCFLWSVTNAVAVLP